MRRASHVPPHGGSIVPAKLLATAAQRDTVFTEAFHDVLRTQVSRDGTLVAALEAWEAGGKSVGELERLLRECDGKEGVPLRRHFDEARLARALAAWQPLPVGDEQIERSLKAAKVHHSTIKCILGRLARASEIVAACQGDTVRFLAAMQSFPTEDRREDRLAYLVQKLLSQLKKGA